MRLSYRQIVLVVGHAVLRAAQKRLNYTLQT